MNCQEQLEQYLSAHNVAYQIHHHPQAYTAQQIAAREHVSGKKVAKSVVVSADNQLALLVLPAAQRVDLDKVRTFLGAQKVSLVNERALQNIFPDCEVGAIPPFGNLYNLPVYVEHSIINQDPLVFPVGTHTATMSLKYTDLERLVQPTLADFAWTPMAV